MVGTIGPLVQGSLPRMRLRIQITLIFATAFVAGAATTFVVVFFLGGMTQLQELPLSLRRVVAAAGMLTLSLLDVWARRSRRYCSLGLCRQTPRNLMRTHSMMAVASIWGFDTGLAITTIRVAAATWGAILLTLLGLTGWQIGIVYGLAFTGPLANLMWTHRAGRVGNSEDAGDSALRDLVDRSVVWQGHSAALLLAAAVVLICEILIDAA